MKYIDAEKLLAEIERLREEYNNSIPVKVSIRKLETKDFIHMGIVEVLGKVLLFAHDSIIQQEQPKETCKTCGFYENNCPFIRGKFIPYPNKVCKDYTYSAMKEQEQPEVDLLKALDDYYNKAEFGPEDAIEYETHKSIAHHFYELGLNARKEGTK